MKVNILKIYTGKFEYLAEATEVGGRYYYRVSDITIEITKIQYDHVIANPYLYYFSTALRLHFLIMMKNIKDWAKEFDVKMMLFDISEGFTEPDKIKNFIHNLLSQKTQETVEEIKNFRKEYQGVWRNKDYQKDFNTSLDQLKKILKQIKK